jgi:hypothetical protein
MRLLLLERVVLVADFSVIEWRHSEVERGCGRSKAANAGKRGPSYSDLLANASDCLQEVVPQIPKVSVLQG